MKQLYFYMSDIITLLYTALPNWPNINTLYTVADRERFSVFRVDHLVRTSGYLYRKVSWVIRCEKAE
jgi:hypothetical protein